MLLRIGSLIAFVLCSPAAFTQEPSATDRFALLVGVNEYEHADLKKLRFAQNDVTALQKVLKDDGYAITLLTGKDATKKTIEEKLTALTKSFPRDGTLIIALAGHGLQFEGDDDNYFCPVDARPFKEKKDTLISVKWIYDRLEKDAAAGPKLLLVDACRNDPKSGRGRGITADTIPNPPRGVGLLLSCSAGETAWEHDGLKHGVFFHHVIEGLNGKAKDDRGAITWDSLRGYVKREVTASVPKLIGEGATQTPEEGGRLAGTPPVLVGDNCLQDFLAYTRLPLSYQRTAFMNENAPSRIAAWRSAADRGLPNAQVLFAMCLLSGRGVEKNADEAIARLRKAADAGNTAAMCRLGTCYWLAIGVPKDEAEAVKWFRKAADAQDSSGVVSLGRMYRDGAGVPKDEAEAVRLFRKGADAGNTNGMVYLGGCYARGEGVEKDEKEGHRWNRKAADAGNTQAMSDVGYNYRNGRGVAQDEAEGLRWYLKSAELGDPAGMTNVGNVYADGLGVPKDDVEAVKWFQKAIAVGQNTRSIARMGVMHADGRGGLAKNEAEGIKLLRQATDADDAYAWFHLGNMYAAGRGVPLDTDEAIKCYQKAAASRDSIVKGLAVAALKKYGKD